MTPQYVSQQFLQVRSSLDLILSFCFSNKLRIDWVCTSQVYLLQDLCLCTFTECILPTSTQSTFILRDVCNNTEKHTWSSLLKVYLAQYFLFLLLFMCLGIIWWILSFTYCVFQYSELFMFYILFVVFNCMGIFMHVCLYTAWCLQRQVRVLDPLEQVL